MNTNINTTIYDNRFMLFFLSYVDPIGSQTIKRVSEHVDVLSDILKMSDTELKIDLGLKDAQAIALIQAKSKLYTIEKEFDILMNSPIKFLTYKDEKFPEKLKSKSQSPAVLFYYGDLPRDDSFSVGIVGSRAATAYGMTTAEYFSEILAENGVNIISGMAVGIDAAAHRGALRSAAGKTIAVLAGGVNVIYPRDNKYIYDEIIDNHRGAVISEMLPGKPAIAKNFPMRNRIVSGLSDILLIVEAREKSGSLITADYARAQNVPVMVIPGRVTDPMSLGTNKLISDGAGIALSPEDIMKIMRMSNPHIILNNEETVKLLDKAEKIVYITLDSEPKHIERIIREAALSKDEAMEALISLELKGFIAQVSSNYYVKNQR